MKKVGWIIAVVAVAALAIFFVVSRGKAGAAAKVTVGRTVTAKRGDIKVTVSENGVLEPVTQVEVKSRVAGRVKRILVKEGDHVTAGALIALIDPVEVERDYARIQAQLDAAQASYRQAVDTYNLTVRQNTLAVKRAEASLREAERRYEQAKAPTRPQEIQQAESAVEASKAAVAQAEEQVAQAVAGVTQATASVNRVEAQITDAKRTLDRQTKLVSQGFVAKSAQDQAQTAVNLAEADRDSARANLKSAQAGQESANASLRSANANLASARQRLALLKEGPRKEDIATAKAAVDTAKTALEAEKANLAQADVRRRDIERSKAEIAQIQNTLAQQNVQLTETRIVAPLAGEITGKYVNEGELVASATAGFAQGAVLVRVADLSEMQVRVNINEVDVAKVKTGQPVEIKVDGAPGKTYIGRVDAIAPASLTANSTSTGAATTAQGVVRFEVKVRVSVPDNRLRPGMTASVAIVLNKRENTLTLPAEALQPGDKVTVVTGKDETLHKEDKKIEIGLRNDATVEVLSGLKEGDQVEVPKVDASDRRKIKLGGGGP